MALTDIFARFGEAVLFIILLILFISFMILWISRFFLYKKIKGSKYLSSETLSLIEHGVIYILLIFLCLGSLFLAARASDTAKTVFNSILKFAPALVAVFIILLFAFIAVGIIHRMFEYFKGNLSWKPKKIVDSRFMSFIELPAEYLVYAICFIFAVVILFFSISSVTGRNLDMVTPLVLAFNVNLNRIILIVVLALIFYLAYKFIDSFLRDIKEHSTRTNPQLIDIVRSGMKYVVALLGGAILLFITLDMVGLPYVGWIVFALVLFMVALVILVVITSPFRNSIAGIMLMTTEPFNINDHVKLLDDTVCDVIRMGLMFTKISTVEGEVMEIPNTEILNHRIINYTRAGSIRTRIFVEVGNDIDRKKIEDLLLKAAIETDGVIDTKPRPDVFVREVKPSSVVYELSAFVSDIQKHEKVCSNLLLSIQDIFKKDGARYISISCNNMGHSFLKLRQ